MRGRDLADYILLAVTWGLSFLVLMNVVGAFGWIGAISLRCLLAGATLFLLAKAMGRKIDLSAGLKPFAIVGATTAAGQLIGLTYATPRIGTAMASILVATIPLFSMIISQLWGLERMNARSLIGLILGTFGILVLVGFPSVPVTGGFLFGCAAALFGNFCAAFGSNYASHKLKHAASWDITMAAFFLGGVMVLPLLYVVPVPAMPRALDVINLVILSCLMSAMAYVVYFRLVGRIGATRAISVEFVVPIVASSTGTLFLGESLTLAQIGAAILIIFVCALVLGLVPRPLAVDKTCA
jgi:drug/metabolite transporter (DMT)-like permease